MTARQSHTPRLKAKERNTKKDLSDVSVPVPSQAPKLPARGAHVSMDQKRGSVGLCPSAAEPAHAVLALPETRSTSFSKDVDRIDIVSLETLKPTFERSDPFTCHPNTKNIQRQHGIYYDSVFQSKAISWHQLLHGRQCDSDIAQIQDFTRIILGFYRDSARKIGLPRTSQDFLGLPRTSWDFL